MNPEAWEKYPGETKLVGKNWADDLIEGDTITGTPTVDITGSDTLTCAFAENEGNVSKFWLSGAVDTDQVPHVKLTIDTTLGETLEDVIQVKVLKEWA